MKKNTLKGIAAACALGAFAVGLGAMSDWYRNWDTSTWFGRGSGNNVVTPDDPQGGSDMFLTLNVPDTESLLMLSLAEDNGVSTSSTTSSSYDLEATLHPSIQGAVRWSVAFADPESAWAKDKTVTDYIAVKSTGALTANVTCGAAFGEQVIVTATYADDETVTASCTADYMQRIVKITPSLNATVDGTEYRFMNGSPYFCVGRSPSFDQIEYTVYVSDVYTAPLKGNMDISFNVGLHDDFKSTLSGNISHGVAPGYITPVSRLNAFTSSVSFDNAEITDTSMYSGKKITFTLQGDSELLSSGRFCSLFYTIMSEKIEDRYVHYDYNDNVKFYVQTFNSMFNNPTLSSLGDARNWLVYSVQCSVDGTSYFFEDTVPILRDYAKLQDLSLSLDTDSIVF